MNVKLHEALTILISSKGYSTFWAEVHDAVSCYVSFFVVGDFQDHARFDRMVTGGDWAGVVFAEQGYEEIGDDHLFAAIHTYRATNLRGSEETALELPVWGKLKLWRTRRSKELPWPMYFVEADGIDRTAEGCTLVRSWKHANYIRKLAA